jgi:hypothetical protein
MYILAHLKMMQANASVFANQQALANFIAERIDQHQFWNWQLTATAKTTVN